MVMDTKLEKVEQSMLSAQAEIECPLTHRFSDGIYSREIFMPAGTVVLGHKHKTRHLNIVLRGRCKVIANDEVKEIVAPCTFESEAGVRKLVNVLEDTVWQTIHVNEDDCENIEQLEARLVEPSHTFIAHKEMERLTS